MSIKKYTEHTNAAYNQIVEHINDTPSLSGLSSVQTVSKTYYNSKLVPAQTFEELTSRKPRFEFCVYLEASKYALPLHHFIFDNEKHANEAYKFYMRKMIDEKIEPYRKLVKKGYKLTREQIAECEKIQALLVD